MNAVGFPERWRREHRQEIRNRRALARALDEAYTPALRAELLAISVADRPTYTR